MAKASSRLVSLEGTSMSTGIDPFIESRLASFPAKEQCGELLSILARNGARAVFLAQSTEVQRYSLDTDVTKATFSGRSTRYQHDTITIA